MAFQQHFLFYCSLVPHFGRLMCKFYFLRCLRMLSLVLGSRITDAAVTSIVSCYTSLELLDLSGYASICYQRVLKCSYDL